MSDAAIEFETHRKFLAGLAYRMLGSVAEAEDVVQDAYLRWRDVNRAEIDAPRSYLARIVSRLCLDRMKSASWRREQYVGTWLPEPVLAEPAHQLADDLSVALLLALERLSPLERAAFLLHDVFDMDYASVAKAIDRSEPACRQLAARAREHVREAQPRYQPVDDEALRIASAFAMALASGDVSTFAQVLSDDAMLYSDGGGKRRAALNPIFGRDKITRFFIGIRGRGDVAVPERVETVLLNGLPGYVIHTTEGPETMSFDVRDGKVAAIYIVRNPDKVRHLA